MEEKINYNCIKEITSNLRKKFKGIQANAFGFCCCTDYDMHHKHKNENDYVCAKIFKGGLNNQYHNDGYGGYFDLYSRVWFMWKLTNFKLEDIINVMQEIAVKYGYKVIAPKDDSECIVVVINEEKQGE